MRVGVAERGGADQPVAAAAVPTLEELLAGVRPAGRHEQLELDRAQAALAAEPLHEREEVGADPREPRCSGAETRIPNSLVSGATSWIRTLPTICPPRLATAISPAPMSPASSDAVVRVAPSRHSPLSAVA